MPFYTTKPAGTGIGHALAKQIASGHAGTLTLVNREDASGSKPRPEARRNGGDWRKRVVDFVAENADQPPPGDPFFLAQGRVHVRKDEELMRHTRNAEEERRRDQRISPVPPEAAG